MTIELEIEDVDVLLESLEYSKRVVRDAQGTPYSVPAVQRDLLRLIRSVAPQASSVIIMETEAVAARNTAVESCGHQTHQERHQSRLGAERAHLVEMGVGGCRRQ
jgi:hypothetical protein